MDPPPVSLLFTDSLRLGTGLAPFVNLLRVIL